MFVCGFFDVMGINGGVGKSFITYFIARETAHDKKVLLIDRDYSSTISRLYGIDNTLPSYLLEESKEPYFIRHGNLTIVNLSCNRKFYKVENNKIAEEFYDKFADSEVVLVDNPSFPDMCFDKYLKLHKRFHGINSKLNMIFVTTQNMVSKNFELIRKRLDIFNPVLGVINKVIEKHFIEPKLDVSEIEKIMPIVKIPFRKEYLITSWKELKTPEEIYTIIKILIEI